MPSTSVLLLLSALPVESLHSQVPALRARAVSFGWGAPLAGYPASRAAPVTMMISVESGSLLLADLPDLFAAVLSSVGVSSADAFLFIGLLILQTRGNIALKDDMKDLKQDLKDDIKTLVQTVSMQQQLNTEANTLLKQDLKDDIKDLKQDFKDDIKDLRDDLKDDIKTLVQTVNLQTRGNIALKDDMKDLKQDLKDDIKTLVQTVSMQQQLNTEANTLLKQDFKNDIKTLKQDFKDDIKDLKDDLNARTSRPSCAVQEDNNNGKSI